MSATNPGVPHAIKVKNHEGINYVKILTSYCEIRGIKDYPDGDLFVAVLSMSKMHKETNIYYLWINTE